MDRKTTLDKASECVLKDRASDHGDLEDNFTNIAAYWSVHLGVYVSPSDVGIMMALLKIARARGNPMHEDNYVDGAGYLACAAETAGKGDYGECD